MGVWLGCVEDGQVVKVGMGRLARFGMLEPDSQFCIKYPESRIKDLDVSSISTPTIFFFGFGLRFGKAIRFR